MHERVEIDGQIYGCFSKKLERKMTMLGPDESVYNSESDSDTEELLQFPVAFLVALTIFWVFFCAYIFLLWEETWSYGLSLYFVIISFMTIGFGDVIPSKSNYILLVGFMLLVGLSLVSTMLTIIQKQITAVADDMKTNIDKDYQNALENMGDARDSSIEPIDGRNGPDFEKNQQLADTQQKPSLENVVSRMPLRSRMLFHLLPDDRR
uniref:Potassium channel domain-containing protein n=1 Tax=Ditylenchus dipsaci TaxID=166011 RepID=A0A915D5Y9_9BILA